MTGEVNKVIGLIKQMLILIKLTMNNKLNIEEKNNLLRNLLLVLRYMKIIKKERIIVNHLLLHIRNITHLTT